MAWLDGKGARRVIDSQIHLWPEQTADRPWSEGRGQLFSSFEIDRYLALLEGSGVDGALVIPPAVDATRIDYAQQIVARFPERFRIAAFVEPHLPEQEAFFAQWKTDPNVLAIRSSILDGNQHLIPDGATDWLWAAAEKHGLPLMFAQTAQLPDLVPIIERHPGLVLILDHFGLSEQAVRKGLASAAIEDSIKLARYPNVSIKLSSAAAISREQYPWHDLDGTIRRLVQAYGPKRCYWGSDLTASLMKSTASYGQRVTHFTQELDFLSEDDRDWIMGRALMERLGWTARQEEEATCR